MPKEKRDWNPEPQPIRPNAKKPTGRTNPQSTHQSTPDTQRGRSQERTERYQDDESSFILSPAGLAAYDTLMETVDIDTSILCEIQERIPGDREKLITVLQSLAMGARHREALDQVNWVWSNVSIYRSKYPVVNEIYNKVRNVGEEMRRITRLDEAHRRATEGSEEDVFSPSGKLVGRRIKYSDALLAMFLKADHPEKFADRVKVESTGVVLNMNMGLRENIRDTPMVQGEIVNSSPFEEEKPEEPKV